MKHSSITFACAVESERDIRHAIALGESVRHFGGDLEQRPVWIFVPPQLAQAMGGYAARLDDAAIEVVPLELGQFPISLPFALKTLAAATAERMAARICVDLLVWMDAGSLVLRQPDDLILPPSVVFGYRPVDHTLIGSRQAEPIDEFWQLVYSRCQTPPGRLFAMPTTVDDQVLRPYFNAGLMVVRPEHGLFRAWADNFARLQGDDSFGQFLTNNLYRVFFHQAILAGTILALVDANQLILLPPWVSYPLHMQDQYPVERRTLDLGQLTTIRHEGVFDDPGWAARSGTTVPRALGEWISERFGHEVGAVHED